MLDQPAPDFELPATGGKTFRLSDARGANLVLYFYPKDNTPGCTREGEQFRDLLAAAKQPLVILGGGGWDAKACDDIRAFVARKRDRR